MCERERRERELHAEEDSWHAEHDINGRPPCSRLDICIFCRGLVRPSQRVWLWRRMNLKQQYFALPVDASICRPCARDEDNIDATLRDCDALRLIIKRETKETKCAA